MNIVVFGALSEKKFISKIKPLVLLDMVKRVHIVRYSLLNLSFETDYKINEKIKQYNFLHKLPKFIYFPLSFFTLVYIILFKKIDVLIGIYYFPYGFVIEQIGRLMNKKVILVFPGSDLDKILKKNMKLINNKKIYYAVRGENSKLLLTQKGICKDNIFILHNLFYLSYTQTPLLEGDRDIDFLYVGYVREQKRIDIIIDSIEKIKIIKPDVCCYIVGDGKMKPNLELVVKEKGLDKNIVFTGNIDNTHDFYKRAKVFVLSSLVEGLPMVLIEAQEYYLPVIAFNINDLSDVVIDNFCGFLLDPSNKDEFQRKMQYLILDENVRRDLGLNARKNVEKLCNEFYSIEAIQKCWVNVLN